MSKAISLERIKGLVSGENTIKSSERQKDISKMIDKVRNSLENDQINANSDNLIVDKSDLIL